MSKSELRRLEIVAPEAIKQLREQIARKIEGLITEPHEVGESCSDCEFIRQAAAIARLEE